MSTTKSDIRLLLKLLFSQSRRPEEDPSPIGQCLKDEDKFNKKKVKIPKFKIHKERKTRTYSICHVIDSFLTDGPGGMATAMMGR